MRPSRRSRSHRSRRLLRGVRLSQRAGSRLGSRPSSRPRSKSVIRSVSNSQAPTSHIGGGANTETRLIKLEHDVRKIKKIMRRSRSRRRSQHAGSRNSLEKKLKKIRK